MPAVDHISGRSEPHEPAQPEHHVEFTFGEQHTVMTCSCSEPSPDGGPRRQFRRSWERRLTKQQIDELRRQHCAPL